MVNYPTDPLKGIGDRNLIDQSRRNQEYLNKHLMVRGQEGSGSGGRALRRFIGGLIYAFCGVLFYSGGYTFIDSHGKEIVPKWVKSIFSEEKETTVPRREPITIGGLVYRFNSETYTFFCEEAGQYAWYSEHNQCFYNPKTKKYDIPLYTSNGITNYRLNPRTGQYEIYSPYKQEKNEKKKSKKHGSLLDNNWKQMNRVAVALTEQRLKNQMLAAKKQVRAPLRLYS